ncbi:hypothetical protein [uncultured Nonlabens sp.]|nr:hypothetical protein [uncultured Nonlabens sp.]
MEIRTDDRTGTWHWFYNNGNKTRQLTYSSGRIAGVINLFMISLEPC